MRNAPLENDIFDQMMKDAEQNVEERPSIAMNFDDPDAGNENDGGMPAAGKRFQRNRKNNLSVDMNKF